MSRLSVLYRNSLPMFNLYDSFKTLSWFERLKDNLSSFNTVPIRITYDFKAYFLAKKNS